jgi:hypothetical protein
VSKKIYKTSTGQVVHAVMAEFKNPADLYHAAETMRDAGYRKWDVYSPFPIHGMEEAMGLRDTWLPRLVGVVGLTMAGVGFAFQYFVRTVYPIQHQGKPADAWQLLIPVTFEIGVLFAAFTCILGMLVFNKLPMWHHPLLKKERFLRTSDDRYVIVIEAADPTFEPEKTRQQLLKAKALNVELVEE